MQLNLGTKIRELRHRDGRTQEALAEALGVISQADPRWNEWVKAEKSHPESASKRLWSGFCLPFFVIQWCF